MVKSKLAYLAAALCFLFLTSCQPKPQPHGIPDPLGSWGHINQDVTRPDDWQRLVADRSIFQLGGLTKSRPDGDMYMGGQRYRHESYNQSYGSFPAIDGSTVLIPMAAEFVWQFLDLDDSETQRFLRFSTTPHAYDKLISGKNTDTFWWRRDLDTAQMVYKDIYMEQKRPDIVFATSPSVAELNMAAAAGVELIVEPVCYDSFVFITHVDNPVKSLTVEQVKAIYSGQITNWNQVGGNDEQIVAYQREPRSGSQTAMEEMVMQGLPMMSAPKAVTYTMFGMGQLVEVVAGYENGTMSLGYTYKYYVDWLYKHPNIKTLAIDGITPSNENVRNKTYPFVAPYNAVIRASDRDAVGGRFMEWMLSDEGQACIAQAGYVALR